MQLRLTARTIKATAVVPAEQLAAVQPAGVTGPQTAFAIAIGDGTHIRGAFNSKTLRRALAAIAELGADNVAVVVQGNLIGDRLEAAGISAQPKAMPPKVEAPLATAGLSAAD